MPTTDELTTFLDDTAPAGMSPLVDGEVPDTSGIVLATHDPRWAETYDALAGTVRDALGLRVLALDHIGSTSVPGLVAKPIIDICLVVADPNDEDGYVAPLVAHGFRLRIREPWWYGHRLLRHETPKTNLHVFGPESPEPLRQIIFRNWLRANESDRALYAEAKVHAGAAANAGGEDVMAYNARKQQVLRDIYARAFAAAGL